MPRAATRTWWTRPPPGRTVYVSGQVGIAQDGKIATDFRAQAVQSLENLKAALTAAGAGLEHVVKITNYFVDISHIAIFREVRDSYFDTKGSTGLDGCANREAGDARATL